MIVKKLKMLSLVSFLVVAASLVLSACPGGGSGSGTEGKTLSAVQERDSLLCGVSTGLAGFSNPDSSGNWAGLDVDICRAVAAAVLGDSEKVTYVPLTAKERFTALQSGEVDVLSRNTTWTITRDTSLGLSFAGVNYYDGAGFLVKKSKNVNRISQLNGATVCIQAGTTTELNLADHFLKNNLKYTPITFETSQQTKDGFVNGRCDALTSDTSQLASIRSTLADPSSAVILGEVISKEPLGPVVRQGDDQWFNINRWALYAMIAGEEFGITSANVDDVRNNTEDPEVKRMLGVEEGAGKDLGIDDNWAYNILSQVGNYGQSFERNVGAGSPLGLPRGVNALWTKGGLLYAMPFR